MLGLDTNVLVRFLVRDHEAQFERARRLIKREVGAREKVLISLLVLLETELVLRSRYGLQKTQMRETNPRIRRGRGRTGENPESPRPSKKIRPMRHVRPQTVEPAYHGISRCNWDFTWTSQ